VAIDRCPRCSARRVTGSDVCPRCQWRYVVAPPPSYSATRRSEASDSGTRCPACSRYSGLDAAFCPHCGTPLRSRPETRQEQSSPPREVIVGLGERSGTHRLLRLLRTIWLVAYPVVSCGPILLGAAAGGPSGGASALGGIILGGVLWAPWIVGIIVLGLLTLLTR
jgi:rRNA maturation protein Nop10